LKDASERDRREHGSGCPEGQAKQQVGEHERPPLQLGSKMYASVKARMFWPRTCYLDRSKGSVHQARLSPHDANHAGCRPHHGNFCLRIEQPLRSRASVTSRRSGDGMSSSPGRYGTGM
jgi:hypothetical protein